MKNQLLKTPLVIVAVLLLTLHVQAQRTQSAEEQSLRLNIQRMVENGPGTAASDENHRKVLLNLRGQLLRLLLKTSGGLETRIANLEAPGAKPIVVEYAAGLRNDLKAVNDEISSLEQSLGGNLPPLAMSSPVPSPAPSPVPSPSVTPTASNPGMSVGDAAKRPDFDAAVARFSSSELERAATPVEVTGAPAPVCNARGRPAVTTFSMYDEAVCRLASDVVTGPRDIDLTNDEQNILTILTAKLLKARRGEGESYAAFVSEAQDKRIDQQMGAGPTSNSATSIVSKGGIPYLFGLAVENGAATRTEKDTSVTFRVNPGGVINMFANRGFITGYRASENDPVLKFLRKTSVGLTFDTSRGDTPNIFTGDRQQLSQITARVEFFNDRDPRQSKYAAAWEKFVANEGVRLADQTWKTTEALVDWGSGDITFKDPALQAWLNQMNESVRNAGSGLTGVERINAVAKIIDEQANRVPATIVSDTAVESITDFARETESYTKRKDELLDTIARGRIFTLEYTNNREVDAPDTSNFNFIYATGSGRWFDFTANGSFTFFHSRPAPISPTSPQAGRIRDFQFAGQIDIPFTLGEGQFDFWFSGKYQRLVEDASLANGVVIPNTKGDIAVGQFGLNVPIRGLGVKFPISVTFANRTELVKEKVVRGNFGFTFNWDTLMSKLNPF